MEKVTPRESKRITYSSEIRALKLLPFNSEQLSIIKGSLLGDGCLHPGWPGTSINYVFSKTHSVKQREYVEWICAKLQPFVLKKPYLYKPVQSLKLRTISHNTLTQLRLQYYLNGKKVLPADICEIIADPIALAVWFMDDGNAVQRKGTLCGYHLNTQSYSYYENEVVVAAFEEILGIHPIIERNHGYYRIGIYKEKSRLRFKEIIQMHIIPSMQYKLGSIGDSLRTRRD